jgi:mutator protein MutT
MKPLNVAAALIFDKGRYLITQRRPNDSFGGFWELPGGKKEINESLEHCVVRELKEELDLDVQVQRFFKMIAYPYPGRLIKLYVFQCSIVSSALPRTLECQDYKWVSPTELKEYRFPDADDELILKLSKIKTEYDLHSREVSIDFDEYQESLKLFNQRYYFECHEILEELWKYSKNQERIHYQALIQIAVALHHLKNGNYKGALSLYQKSVQRWHQLPEFYMGINLKDFKLTLGKIFEAVEKNPKDFLINQFPQIELSQ